MEKHIKLELFSRFLKDEVNREEEEFIKTHLKECKNCRQLLQKLLKEILEELEQLKDEEKLKEILFDVLTDPSNLEKKTSECLSEIEILDYIEGKEISHKSKKDIENHIFNCPYCTAQYVINIMAKEELEYLEMMERYSEEVSPVLLSYPFAEAEKVSEYKIAGYLIGKNAYSYSISNKDLFLEKASFAGEEIPEVLNKIEMEDFVLFCDFKFDPEKTKMFVEFGEISDLISEMKVGLWLLSGDYEEERRYKERELIKEVDINKEQRKAEFDLESSAEYELIISYKKKNKIKEREIKLPVKVGRIEVGDEIKKLISQADDFVIQGELDKALICLMKIKEFEEEIGPYRFQVYSRLIWLYLSLGCTEKAEKELKELEKKYPNDDMVKVLKAEYILRKENYKKGRKTLEAIKMLKEVVDKKKGKEERREILIHAYLALIFAYGKLNMKKNVLRVYLESISNMRNCEVDAMVVRVLKEMGEKELAEKILSLTIKLLSSNKIYLEKLAGVFKSWNLLEEHNQVKAKIASLEGRLIE